jgi:general secretion pathway protein A
MFLHYFGFKQEPFGATPDPRCLYPSHAHREALASLEYGFRSNRGFTAMIAPPGMGKTTLLFRFLEDVRETARTVFLFDIDSDCEPREFVRHILRDIGVIPGTGSSEMHEQLSCALAKETRAGRKFVIVIDEAQNLSNAVLERVRLLSNFETSQGKLMQIVLSGQPQLAEKLMQPSLIQLRQRVSTICRIDSLSSEETVAYIEYRLKQAGYVGDPLFTKDALEMITEASLGTPRTINNLCFNALSLCLAMKSKQVNGSMVAEVIEDLELIPQSGESILATSEVADVQSYGSEDDDQPKRLVNRLLLAAAALVVLCVAGVFGFAGLRTFASHSANDERSLDQKALPAHVTAPIATDTAETKVTEPAQSSKEFEITVQADQRLQDISVQYLGGFDLQRLHQIQALNPKLTNPDHIEIGQRIWLPGKPPVPVTRNETPPTGERKLP